MIASNPIRATALYEQPISIAMRGPADVGAYAEAQRASKLVQVAGDSTRCVLTKATSDAHGFVTIPALAALAQSTRTCKYMRHLSSEVETPLDAHIIDKAIVSMDIGDQNLNAQRFVLRALKRRNGTLAGARFALAVNAVRDDFNSFLLVYRDCTTDFSRPITVALAKLMPPAMCDLLCIELSIRELLVMLGGHSKLSPFNATAGIPPKLPRYMPTRMTTVAKITVWGDDEADAANMDKDALVEDSINPVEFKWEYVAGQNGASDENPVPVVTLTTPPSTCGVLAETTFHIVNVDTVAAFFGANDSQEVACVPTGKDPMVPKCQQWQRPASKKHKARNEDAAKIDPANICTGRRAAVFASDLRIRRHAADEAFMHDGQYLPGHPLYDVLQEELDAINFDRAEAGLPALTDERLASADGEAAALAAEQDDEEDAPLALM